MFQGIKELLEKEASNTLHPEAEAANPKFKLYLQYKTENVSNVRKDIQNNINKFREQMRLKIAMTN